MDRFGKIVELVKDHQKEVDKVFSEYQKAEKKARERYRPDAFEKEFIQGQWPTYAGKVRAMVDISVKTANGLFDDIADELTRWATARVDPGILETLRYVREFDLRLSRHELEALEPGIRDSYMGQKIFSAVARDSGFETQMIQMDELLNALKSARSCTEAAIRCYAGPPESGFWGRDLIDHRFVDGSDWGEYSPADMTIAASFPVKGGSLLYAEEIWERSRAPIHYELTKKEAEALMREIGKVSDGYGHVSKDDADQLLARVPDIMDRMSSLPDTDLEQVKALQKYYVLGGVGPADTSIKGPEPSDSLLKQPAPAMEAAKEYARGRGMADTGILDHF